MHGIISGFKIDHNTGNLISINGLPISSGGANPGPRRPADRRTVPLCAEPGLTTRDGGPAAPTDPCANANITQFAIGGNGVLAPQETFFTQGINPIRMIADTSGSLHLLVLDHDAPDGAGCTLRFGPSVTTCGDITAFTIDPTTGRLSWSSTPR